MPFPNRKIMNMTVMQSLMKIAAENGYILMVNGTKDNSLNIVAFPFRETICSQEELARSLSKAMDDFHITTSQEAFDSFKSDIEPDDIAGYDIAYDDIDRNLSVHVFTNSNNLIKQINLKM